jgi:CBS domain-containing protein
MKIERLLRDKGDFVATVTPETSVKDALAELARHRIGALVVSSDGRSPEGIVSERDIVRALHETGPAVIEAPVSTIMSSPLHLAGRGDEVESLRTTMTNHRIRHVPVVEDGILVGIVSIGDVVKTRMGELEDDRRALEDYIHAR